MSKVVAVVSFTHARARQGAQIALLCHSRPSAYASVLKKSSGVETGQALSRKETTATHLRLEELQSVNFYFYLPTRQPKFSFHFPEVKVKITCSGQSAVIFF